MKCANHAEVDSVAFCGHCGKPLCGDCRKEIRGTSYCESCLAERMQKQPVKNSTNGGPIPGLALGLGFIPGVGAIYNGQVLKGIVQVLIFGSLVGVGERVEGAADIMFKLVAWAFYFYMVIDSYQTAKRKRLGQPVEEWFGLADARLSGPIGGALLIILGTMFLLDNLGLPVFSSVGRFWPVLLILVGVLMLQKRLRGDGPPPPPKQDDFPGPQSM